MTFLSFGVEWKHDCIDEDWPFGFDSQTKKTEELTVPRTVSHPCSFDPDSLNNVILMGNFLTAFGQSSCTRHWCCHC